MSCVSTTMGGLGIWGLSKGKHILSAAIEKQYPRPLDREHYCIQCGDLMSRPTLYTGDAGQAYEMIQPSRVERAFRMVFKAVQITTKKENPTISCQHTTKVRTCFGGRVRGRLGDRTILLLSKIAHCMRSLVKLRWYKFGNAYLWQKAGIPIGGPVSGAVLESVLSVDEHVFDKFKWPKNARRNWDSKANEKTGLCSHGTSTT